jgi:hypothetical protein
VLMDRPGGAYWKTWDKNAREHLMRNHLISPDDLYLYQITDSAEQAVRWITRFYRNFHSTRWIKDSLVIRLRYTPQQSAIDALNDDFADIIVGDKIHITGPLKEEIDDKDVVDMPRVAFGFDRRHYGRLRQLIDVLNSF